MPMAMLMTTMMMMVMQTVMILVVKLLRFFMFIPLHPYSTFSASSSAS